MNVNKLYDIVSRNKFLWMDLTEKCYKNNKYPLPQYYTATYKDSAPRTFLPRPQSPAEMFFNTLILSDIVTETNHLVSYIKKAIELKRETYLEGMTKLVNTYERFLEANNVKRSEDGRFISPETS